MEQRIFGGPPVPAAEKIVRAIDKLVDDLCRGQDGDEQVFAMREAAHAAAFAVGSIVWAHQGSEARGREIEKRALAAFQVLAGGVSLREKQHAVLRTLEIAAQREMLDVHGAARTLAFFRERIHNIFPKALLRSVTIEDLALAIQAAGRKPGRRRGTKTGQKSKSKSEIINDFLRKLEIQTASGSALEKARERRPEIPRLPD